jgi:hypothetical protein
MWRRSIAAMRIRLPLLILLMCFRVAGAEDAVTVRWPSKADAALPAGPAAGRMVLLLKSTRCRESGDPCQAPFFSDPQPVLSVPVAGFGPGGSVRLGPDAQAWPGPLDGFTGPFDVQAVFKRNRQDGSLLAPGNLISQVIRVEFDPDTDQAIELDLQSAVASGDPPVSRDLVIIDEPSPMLTRALGRATHHRAAVVLPPGYHEVDHPRRMWPTVYVIPGFGGTLGFAAELQRLLSLPGAVQSLPQAVHVVLDPSGPFGHHGFADSVMNGPRGAALVQELVPMLEERFRLVRRPEARLLTGHSSGGWSSLWLQLTNPDFFGGCWSSAPDPVDFSAFQHNDLYRDPNLFHDAEGEPRPSFRRPVGPLEKVLMSVQEEMGVERAIDPAGGSGQQWDAWQAMFGMPDPATGMPARLADPASGAIDHRLVDESWSAYDIARLVERRWSRLWPVLRDKVRLLVGDRDEFYLERAVQRLKAKVEALRAATQAEAATGKPSGFMEILPGATHGSAASIARGRFALDMREHLKRHGLGD